MTGGLPASEGATAAERVVGLLTDRRLTVATCESLTAGLLSARIADVPGASAVLRGGLVTYATDLKHSLARVDSARLESFGPVDAVVASQMADAAARLCGAHIGVATTGVAGPDPVGEHPVGTVWIAVTGMEPRRLRLCGDRSAIRAQTVDAALELILEAVSSVPGVG